MNSARSNTSNQLRKSLDLPAIYQSLSKDSWLLRQQTLSKLLSISTSLMLRSCSQGHLSLRRIRKNSLMSNLATRWRKSLTRLKLAMGLKMELSGRCACLRTWFYRTWLLKYQVKANNCSRLIMPPRLRFSSLRHMVNSRSPIRKAVNLYLRCT